MRYIACFLIIISIFSIFSSCEEVDPGAIQPTPPPEADPVSLVEFQGIETNGAMDWEYFSIGDEYYLAVANYSNNLTLTINSKIYKWNGYTFTLYQKIGTNGAMDFEYFSIEGNHYLAVANFSSGSTYNVSSVIYKWDIETATFILFQTILTSGATDWEYFNVNGNHYLVVANSYNGSIYNIPSEIIKWNGINFTENYQLIETHAAYDWEFFTIGENYFLIVANHYNGTTYNIDSELYQWDDGNKNFVFIQGIPTNGANDWEYFTSHGAAYLAVANYYSGTEYTINSRIYKWEGVLSGFTSIQPFETNGACDMEYFTIDDIPYIAVANTNDDDSRIIDSALYSWDADSEKIIAPQLVETTGAVAWKYFTLGDDPYLAVANYTDGANYNNVSMIYKVIR
ncbi:MAG: hypothetical protein JXJ04_21250 [Spirochaetales bacterium]|nr:hypothetical protein [Spirochaetales bacterium]